MGIEYKFNSIICILYIYKDKDFYIIFPNSPPAAAFVVLLARPLVRPPLALVGDRHPNSHVTDANAG